jgi:hypothetical protein
VIGQGCTQAADPGGLFFIREGTIKMMEAFGNLTNGTELGYISPLGMEWFAVFEFDDCGYVKDDEKNMEGARSRSPERHPRAGFDPDAAYSTGSRTRSMPGPTADRGQ